MGTVYLAEQTVPVRRKVALKIIKRGLDTKQVVARFEAERQALALMDHPTVAKVFEAGSTPEGLPYFVMEYVQGVPITEHCDRHRLSTRERLELFAQVCEGVQHAHQKAIIHRDLKPSNVLIAIQGDRPVPKIIDFGVAKATAQRLTERTMFTELGVLIGTPEYMSPEQAEMTVQGVDTRTDVYSLGVMLYELLTGALPFDPEAIRRVGLDEMRRHIREKEPPRPSTRLTTLEGATSEEIARRHRTDSRSLIRELRGDLDWVVMKAIEKDRTRRYASPSELAADVRRHLTHEPVLARAPSRLYRLTKLARRRKAAVLAAAVVIGTVVIGLGVGTAVHLRSEAAKDAALRWTLEQVIAKGARPDTIQSEWSELERRMLERVRAEPDGELARLAVRAAARFEVVGPTFGLLSNPPRIELSVNPTDLGVPYMFIADVEGSWDGGPWQLLGSCFAHALGPERGWSLADGHVPLAEALGADRLTAAPHSLDLRVRISWLDPDSPSWPEEVGSSMAHCVNGPLERYWPEAPRRAVLDEETRTLDPIKINLFETYPDDFPAAVAESGITGPLARWFRLERVRILRVTCPEPPGSKIFFLRPGFVLTIDHPRSAARPGDPVLAGFEINGRMVHETPLPIAAEASLRVDGSEEPVVSFQLAVGPGVLDIGPGWYESSALDAGDTTRVIATYRDIENPLRPIHLPETAADRVLRGRIELVPSRDIALRTKKLDRYLGTSVVLPVEVEILTLDGYASSEELHRAMTE